MKKKNTITIVLVLAVSATTLAFGSQSSFTRKLFSLDFKELVRSDSQIPPQVLYDKLFRMVFSIRIKAESQKMSDEKINGSKNYFKNRANLTDEENQILQNTALEFIQQVAPIDANARTIIAQKRASNLTGVVSKDDLPPVELINLQEQRNALALLYRDRLKESLGSDGSAKFVRYIEGEFASRFEEIKLSEINFDQNQK